MQNFSLLGEHCIFRTREKSDSHALVATELADHFLRWRGDRIDARMCKLDTENLSLYSLKYGSGVDIFPKAYDGFSLIHFSLHKAIEVTADRQSVMVPMGRALLSSPRQNISLRYEENCEQLILRLPHTLTRRLAQNMGRVDLHDRLVHTPGLLLSEAASVFWHSHLHSFVALDRSVRQREGLSTWQAHFEESFALFLLMQLGDVQMQTSVHSGFEVASSQRVDRLFGYVRAHLDEPISLADMATAAALSERQLNVLCHDKFGQSPMQWLRGLRLDAIRSSLRQDPGQSLAALATQFGFFHFGRFSTYYRQRFGELPSKTRRTARSG